MVQLHSSIGAALLLLSACASTHHAGRPLMASQRVESPVSVPPSAPTVAVAEQTLVPGVYRPIDTLRRIPAPGSSAPVASSTPYEVIANANREAASAPSTDGYFNAIQTYIYTPGMLYQVYCATMHVTDLALQPGEKHVGPLVTGDSVRWVLDVTESAEHDVKQEHIVIKPTQPGLSTNLVINTDRRSYFLELHSYKDDTYMVSVRWRYPQDEVAQRVADRRAQEEKQRQAVTLNPASLNFHYALEIVEGDPDWLPTQVFDDQRKTYVRFPSSMRMREVPMIYVVRDGELQLVNFYPRGDFYVVDRLFDVGELRVGQQHQEIVRIERLRR